MGRRQSQPGQMPGCDRPHPPHQAPASAGRSCPQAHQEHPHGDGGWLRPGRQEAPGHVPQPGGTRHGAAQGSRDRQEAAMLPGGRGPHSLAQGGDGGRRCGVGHLLLPVPGPRPPLARRVRFMGEIRGVAEDSLQQRAEASPRRRESSLEDRDGIQPGELLQLERRVPPRSASPRRGRSPSGRLLVPATGRAGQPGLSRVRGARVERLPQHRLLSHDQEDGLHHLGHHRCCHQRLCALWSAFRPLPPLPQHALLRVRSTGPSRVPVWSARR